MENKTLIVKLNKNDVYRQLLAMCNDSEDYSLQQGDYKDKELECLSVADRKQITAEKMNIPLRKKILGYIRLLPNNDDTLIAFVHKNRPEWYDHPVINPELWDSFIKAVFGYFKGDLAAPTVDAAKADEATKIKREALIKMAEVYSEATDAINGKPAKDKAGTAQDEAVLKNDDAIKRFGTDRDLSLSDVKGIVKRCNNFEGKVTEFWREYSDNKYTLETLRKWRDDHRFTE